MKGRPKNVRKISFMPAVSGFRPYGENVEKGKKDCVFLHYEEYEALRLNDYEKHSQCESAKIMQISRPTFTRIYMSAREKIAKAFVEGLRIVVEGGKVELDGNWWVCDECKAVFNNAEGNLQICALCGSKRIRPYALPNTKTGELMGITPKRTPVKMKGKEYHGPISSGLSLHGKGCCRGYCRTMADKNNNIDNKQD